MADYRIPKIDNGWTKLRKENHTSVQDIADAVGICSRARLNDIFRGKRIAYDDELKMLCMYFKIPLEEGKRINEESYRKANEGLNPTFTRGHKKEPYMIFKTPLNELRMENKLTLKDIAEYCGVTGSNMSMIFNGKIQCTPAIKEKLKELFDLGYAQISDLCNRTYNFHPNGDLRKRSRIHPEKDEPIDPYAPTPEDLEDDPVKKKIIDWDNHMVIEDEPEIDYSQPMDAPENDAYRKWRDENGDIRVNMNKEEHPSLPVTYADVIDKCCEEMERSEKDYCESAERSKKARKADILDRMLDVAYGKVDRKEFVRLENVLRRYWLE